MLRSFSTAGALFFCSRFEAKLKWQFLVTVNKVTCSLKKQKTMLIPMSWILCAGTGGFPHPISLWKQFGINRSIFNSAKKLSGLWIRSGSGFQVLACGLQYYLLFLQPSFSPTDACTLFAIPESSCSAPLLIWNHSSVTSVGNYGDTQLHQQEPRLQSYTHSFGTMPHWTQ